MIFCVNLVLLYGNNFLFYKAFYIFLEMKGIVIFIEVSTIWFINVVKILNIIGNFRWIA